MIAWDRESIHETSEGKGLLQSLSFPTALLDLTETQLTVMSIIFEEMRGKNCTRRTQWILKLTLTLGLRITHCNMLGRALG